MTQPENELNVDLIRCIRAFIRLILMQVDLNSLEVAIALEDLASEIRQRKAKEWAEQNNH